MTDIITKPGNYCRADGVKVRIEYQDEEGEWRSSDGSYWTDGESVWGPIENIISKWSDRPDEFRKPKPAYRKDGSPRWPVGTRAVLVAWEDQPVTMQPTGTMTVADDGTPTWDFNGSAIIGTKGFRPLFRKIKDTAQ